MKETSQKMNLGLIGKSLSHSFSKHYFDEKCMKESLIGYSYTNFDIENLDDLPQIIQTHQLSGLNVTKPYKEKIIPFLNEIDSTAKEIGAVNCVKISWKDNVPYLTGYNTDFYGFAQSIKPFLEPAHQKALILGTGGASKAVYFALKHIGIDVYYVTTGEKKSPFYFHYEELNQQMMDFFKLIINCTPLGLFPLVNEYPLIPYEFITKQHLMYDLIYNPTETLFLKKSKDQGATIINGLNMLKLQAEKAWNIWHDN